MRWMEWVKAKGKRCGTGSFHALDGVGEDNRHAVLEGQEVMPAGKGVFEADACKTQSVHDCLLATDWLEGCITRLG